ncbi:MAG: proline iminopeptidase-family hydrolase [Treponema sp.]|nr:proline iminopeptidase-family hydrolase [Treponema sp.]
MSSFKEGYIEFRDYKTYYCIVGECEAGKTPLLTLHGGPGSGSKTLRDLDPLSASGRSIIYYDQLGAVKSEIPSAPELWKAETWVEELLNLIDKLKLDSFHLFGHSWGGMLALQTYIEKKPKQVKSLVLASTMASSDMWCKEGRRLAGLLPPEMRDAIFEAEESGVYEGDVYEKAVWEFYGRHLCNIKPMPKFILEGFEKPNESYLTAWGPSEFNCTGTLKGWDYRERLGELKVPTLITSGLMDECTPWIAKNIHDGIPGSRWELFEHSSHLAHCEEKERYLSVLADFLAKHD